MNYISGILENDSSALTHIYQNVFPKVLSFVLKNKGQQDHAKDVFQDALYYLTYKIKHEGLKIDNFEAYLYTICKNRWQMELKKTKNKVTDSIHDIHIHKAESAEASYVADSDEREAYLRAFQKLSENCAEILSLYFNNVSYKDLKEEFKYVSESVVRQRVFKCRQKLIGFIKKELV